MNSAARAAVTGSTIAGLTPVSHSGLTYAKPDKVTLGQGMTEQIREEAQGSQPNITGNKTHSKNFKKYIPRPGNPKIQAGCKIKRSE
jgi:hypothetical protein